MIRTWPTGFLSVAMLMLLLGSAPSSASPADRFHNVRQLLRNNELDTALVEVSQLRSDYPHDVDYAFARAQILERLQRDDEALSELALATGLAPEYEDVWRLRLLILSRYPDKPEYDAVAAEVASRFPMATWQQPDVVQPFWNLNVGAAYDKLSNDLPSWDNQFIGLAYEKPQHYRYGAELARDARFAGADYSLRLSTRHSFMSRWFAGAALGIADDPQFQPGQDYGLHVGAQIGDGWTTTLAFRRREYTGTSVNSLIGSVEKYYGSYRFAYSMTAAQLEGSSTSLGHTFTTNWYINDKSSIGITLSGGEEAEAIGNGAVLKTDVRGVSLSGRYQLGERYTLQGWLGTHEQGDFYRRRFLGLAISIRI